MKSYGRCVDKKLLNSISGSFLIEAVVDGASEWVRVTRLDALSEDDSFAEVQVRGSFFSGEVSVMCINADEDYFPVAAYEEAFAMYRSRFSEN